MIATGNHNFERFAALCNTPGGSQGVLTFSVYALLQTQKFLACSHQWDTHLFTLHSYLLPTPTQVGAAGRVRNQRIGTACEALLASGAAAKNTIISI